MKPKSKPRKSVKKKLYLASGAASEYAVLEASGAILYDLIETEREAEIIRDLLNAGAGPEWDKIQDEVEALLAEQPC